MQKKILRKLLPIFTGSFSKVAPKRCQLLRFFAKKTDVSDANILYNYTTNCEIGARIDVSFILNCDNFLGLMRCNLTAEFDYCEF